ncbi:MULTISPECIES: hypothetical protein [Pantoea]|jgi:hypothetical protein|uniref:hypothetical protein n=1 Tax=Pantoea TaxID=53335 RepID=UPI000232364A|nr:MULTISPECIES: hypothetical protein [Pantoea]AER33209.1 hypothetical protein PAGR_g2711 [Pantoea ananatis PA13]ERM11594.1 hypothetical protein L585_21275 [Pantoea ananatis BRT175]MCH9269010.1 hypothetical protein [Pantoea ananatis]MCS3405462.1 hypothetical protein [Pantoea sp. B566]MCS4493649.1 hypothetical protein [Pantoea sp. B623]
MESRDDKLIAIIGLLTACLIGVTFLFVVTWLNDSRLASPPERLDTQTCYPKPPSRQL